MTEMYETSDEECLPDPQVIIDEYGLDAPVRFENGLGMTLGQALAFEERFCKPNVDDGRRLDPAKRSAYLMKILVAGKALPTVEEA